MITDIWVNGNKLDMYSDVVIDFNFQVNDIADVQDRQSSYTNSFSIPKTENNIQHLQGLGITSDTSRIPYQKPSCQVKLDGYDIIVKGWLNVSETSDEYKIYVYSGVINFFKAIENKTIGQDLDLSEINHDKNVLSVVSSQTNPYYRYLVADYNGKTHYKENDDEIVNIDYLVPSANIKYLWDKIFNTFGFTYSGNIFSTSDFTDWWVSFPKGILLDGSLEPIEERTGTENYTQSSPYMTASGQFGAVLPIMKSGKYVFDFNLDLSGFSPITISSIPLKIQIYQNAVVVDEFEIFSNGSHSISIGYINLNSGDNITFYWSWGQIGNYSISIDYEIATKIFVDTNYSFNEEFQDFGIKDFIKEVLNRLSLTMFPKEHSNEITFKTLSERLTNPKIIDWSDKYIERKNEDYVFGSYAQKNIFSYQYSDKESDYENKSFTIDNVNLDDIKNVFQSKIYAPERDFVPFKIGAQTYNSRVYKVYDKEITEENDIQKISYKGLSKRFFFLKSERIDESLKIGSEAKNETDTINFIYAASYSGQSWKEALPKFYTDIKYLVNDSRIHKINIDANLIDAINLDFDAIYYFRQESQYYLLNKFNYGKNNTGDFLRINYNTETFTPEEPDESNISISWLDDTTYNRIGNDDSIGVKILNSLNINSFVWQYLDIDWVDDVNVSPTTMPLVEGINKFRIKATTTIPSVIYSNTLQYTRIIPDPTECLKFRFGYSGSQPSHVGIVKYIDCDNVPRQLNLTFEESGGNYYEIEICAISITSIEGAAMDVTNYNNQQMCTE